MEHLFIAAGLAIAVGYGLDCFNATLTLHDRLGSERCPTDTPFGGALGMATIRPEKLPRIGA